MKILLAEDTKDLNHAVSTMLSISGFEVHSAFDGEEASELLLKNGYDGVILDIMMPKKNGLEVLTDLRKAGDTTPVLLLTAKSEIDDRVNGLDLGADDYLTKPFAMKELLARVRALTRRNNAGPALSGELKAGDLVLACDTFELRSGSSIRLSVKEFELMHLLASGNEKEIDSSEILSKIWPGDDSADDNTVWLYISYLRTKLFSVGSRADIKGVKGGAFRLCARGPEEEQH